jgi:ribonuclease HI
MAGKKIYAVRVGRKPGIYRSWEDCLSQVEGFSGAAFKSFTAQSDAEAYLNGDVKKAEPIGPAPALESSNQVVIYTDGACTGNPGPGGYGVVMIHGANEKELSAGFRLTTNNRMEILACIAGLEALKRPSAVTIYSDSKYVVNAMNNSWAVKWRSRGWKRKLENGEMKDALNADLWAQMLDLCDKHEVTFRWVRGHDGNEGNERCDRLARSAAASPQLSIDTPYERLAGKME